VEDPSPGELDPEPLVVDEVGVTSELSDPGWAVLAMATEGVRREPHAETAIKTKNRLKDGRLRIFHSIPKLMERLC